MGALGVASASTIASVSELATGAREHGQDVRGGKGYELGSSVGACARRKTVAKAACAQSAFEPRFLQGGVLSEVLLFRFARFTQAIFLPSASVKNCLNSFKVIEARPLPFFVPDSVTL